MIQFGLRIMKNCKKDCDFQNIVNEKCKVQIIIYNTLLSKRQKGIRKHMYLLNFETHTHEE